MIYSGSVLSDRTNEYDSNEVGLELAGGLESEGSGSLKFSTSTGRLEITGAFQTTGDGTFGGTVTATSGTIGGWNIGTDALFFESSSTKTTLSGSKGPIKFYSGSYQTEVGQIDSDIDEDTDDPLATPGMLVKDGIIFLKRQDGDMPAGTKSGGSADFEQLGTRIKPGFLHIYNSGSNTDTYQRFTGMAPHEKTAEAIFKIRSINQNTSGSGYDKTIGMMVSRETAMGGNATPNVWAYNSYLKVETGSAILYGGKIDDNSDASRSTNHYLLDLEGTEDDNTYTKLSRTNFGVTNRGSTTAYGMY